MPTGNTIPRRKLLQALGAGSAASVAGCIGSITGGGGGGGGGKYLEEAKKIGYDKDIKNRRLATFDEWPKEKRKKVPPRKDGEKWADYEAFTSSPWKPPEGWDDTIAGDVDEIKILNHGAVTMQYDPATKALHEKFEAETGITITPMEMGVGKANTKEQQILQSKKGEPVLMDINGPLVPLLAKKGYLAPVDVLFDEKINGEYIPALEEVTKWDAGDGERRYAFNNITEGSLGHLRADLVKEKGFDPKEFQGEWDWSLLEDVMKAFKDDNKAGYAFYAGDSTYFSYSFRELLYQQGGRLVQKDGKVKVNTDEAITVLQKMNKWYSNGWVPGDVTSYAEGSIVDLFKSGQVALATGMSDFVPKAMEAYEPGTQYQAILPPKATEGSSPEQAALVDPNGVGINTYSSEAKKTAATLYGDLRLSYDANWWEFTYEGNMSFMNQVYKDSTQVDIQEYITEFGDVLGNAIDNGVVELFTGMQSTFQQLLTPAQDAITGAKDPEKALNEVQNFVDENVNTES